jgi:hypothetical protein
MSAALDYGRKILMKRMIQNLESEGYRVEFAEEYNGWIVAGQGEDPAVMLLEANAIERFRTQSPGNARGFLDGIVEHVKSQISAQGSVSLQPPASGEAAGYADVPSEPPSGVGAEVGDDMIVDEQEAAVEDVPMDVAGDVPTEDAPPPDAPPEETQEADGPPEEDLGAEPAEGGEHPEGEAAEGEQERMEKEITEELSVEDVK